METWVKRLAVVATVGMFLVLFLGATVTNTGSAEGCGRSWPLCHGEFIPSYALETAIEFSHRVVTAIEGFFIAAVAIGALRLRRGHLETKIYVGLMVGTLLLQSGLGASAVLWPQRPAIMAVHFGISLVCFASVFLLTRLLYQTSGGNSRPTPSAVSMSPWFRRATWLALIGALGVAYLGAYMRHGKAELACYEWPQCTRDGFIPTLSGPVGIALGHRLAAAALVVLVAGLTYVAYRHRETQPELFRVNLAALILLLLQALAGGFVVLTRLELWTTLAHAGLMALFFICVADACRQVRLRSAPSSPAGRVVLTPASGAAGGSA
ncbi:MAG TPA: COX15/CtaA family protein [Thermomicrobiales bacterium]